MSRWQRMFSTAINDSPKRDCSVLNLRIGDTVSHDLIDYLVTGQDTYYNDLGHTWTDYHLEGDGDTWLVFEKDLDVAAIYKTADLDFNGKPSKEIKYQGIIYYLDEFSRAGVVGAEGQRETDRGNLTKYWQYQDKTGGYVIYVEDSRGTLEASCGYCIRPQEIKLMRKLRAIY